jgi:hypothetical protein
LDGEGEEERRGEEQTRLLETEQLEVLEVEMCWYWVAEESRQTTD